MAESTLNRLTKRFFRLPVSAQFFIWFVLILVVKFDTLFAPPVWDTAMGVFPPAIFLYENNFDLMQLIQLTGWWQGGPNVYSLSSWTWLISGVMFLTNSSIATFFILHCLTFAMCALAIALLVRTLTLMGIKPYLAILAGVLLLTIPLVSVQIGYMYTEAPVMALSILAWASWYHRRETLAVLLALVAISIKPTGLIIGLCLLPLLFIRLINRFSFKRLLLFMAIPVFYHCSNSIYRWLDGKDNSVPMPWGPLENIVNDMLNRLNHAADVTYFIGCGIVAAILYAFCQWYRSGQINPISRLYQECIKNGSSVIAACFIFTFILGVAYRIFEGDLFLYRYVIPLLPFIIIVFLLFAQSFRIQGTMAAIAIMLCGLFAYNHSGTQYNQTSAFSFQEHSHAYKRFVSAQQSAIEQISKLDDTTPIFVSREIDYMTSHPMMGYLDEIKPNIVGIYTSDYINIDTQNLPDSFYLVFTNSSHGGERISPLRYTLRDEGVWNVERVYEQNFNNIRMTVRRLYKPDES